MSIAQTNVRPRDALRRRVRNAWLVALLLAGTNCGAGAPAQEDLGRVDMQDGQPCVRDSDCLSGELCRSSRCLQLGDPMLAEDLGQLVDTGNLADR